MQQCGDLTMKKKLRRDKVDAYLHASWVLHHHSIKQHPFPNIWEKTNQSQKALSLLVSLINEKWNNVYQYGVKVSALYYKEEQNII